MGAYVDLGLWVVSLLLTATVSWAITRRFSSRRLLAWELTQTEIAHAGSDGRLRLLYDGHAVERVCVAAVVLRNSGNRPLTKGAELRVPLRVLPPPGAKLLQAELGAQSCDEVEAAVLDVTEEHAHVTFGTLNPGEEVRLQIVHDGACSDQPRVQGRLVGARVLRALSRPERRELTSTFAASVLLVGMGAYMAQRLRWDDALSIAMALVVVGIPLAGGLLGVAVSLSNWAYLRR